MRRFEARGPYMPARDLPKIAVVALQIELDVELEPGLPPLVSHTWCVGPTPTEAVENWRATYRGTGKLVGTTTLADPKHREHADSQRT